MSKFNPYLFSGGDFEHQRSRTIEGVVVSSSLMKKKELLHPNRREERRWWY